jgi:DNA-binding transcriptional LysR family regulator
MLQTNSIHVHYSDMEFDDIRAFVSIADSGSVSGAARALHVTQSAVTKRVQRLETALGTTLLDRAQRPIALTGPGQSALERCRRLLNDINDVRASIATDRPLHGEMRIGVAHALNAIALTKPLGMLRQEFPALGLRLATGWSRDLLERVRAGALDAAVILLPEEDRLPAEVFGTVAGRERLVVAGAKRQAPLRRLRDLAGALWILNPEGCSARAMLRRTLLRGGIELMVAVESYDYGLQLLLAGEGRGLTLVPERILRRSPERARLKVFDIAGFHFPFNVWSVHRGSAGLEPVLSRLNNALGAELRAKPGMPSRNAR